MRYVAYSLVLLAIISAAGSRTVYGADEAAGDQSDRRPLAPLPEMAPAPHANPSTAPKVALGNQLFFDPRLSGDNQVSCATCHVPGKGFSDGLPRARGPGAKSLGRNTPTVLNVGFYAEYFWDGRVKSLEQQALMPIESPDEMNQNLGELIRELSAIPGYVQQFQAVFQSPITREGIAEALAAFERTLVSRNAPLDRYLAGDKQAMSEKAIAGMELFVGQVDCIRCHDGPHLSDGKFYRLGVGFRDQGRGAVTGRAEDAYKFRTPSLRDVARTGPYMHDGSLETLFDVVQFYFRGVPDHGPGGLELDIDPLFGQSFSDMEAIVEFLKSLSGESPKITPPALP